MTRDAIVCVCLSVCDYVSGTTHLIFTKFSFMLPVAVAWSSDSIVIMLRISGFVNNVIVAHKLIGCSTSLPGEAVRFTRTQP